MLYARNHLFQTWFSHSFCNEDRVDRSAFIFDFPDTLFNRPCASSYLQHILTAKPHTLRSLISVAIPKVRFCIPPFCFFNPHFPKLCQYPAFFSPMSSFDTTQSPMKEPNPATEKTAGETSASSKNEEPQVRDWRFWMVFAALAVTGLLSAIEATIISTALPTIVHNLNVGNNYAWIANSYFLTS
jgi:hypothetical protein